MDTILFHFIYGFIACTIGALPFGLVNLSVVDLTVNKLEKAAILFSVGASFIEVLFALAAILIGKQLNSLIKVNVLLEFGVVAVILVSSVYFFTKKYHQNKRPKFKIPFLFKGMFFNLISFQVLLYWFLAIAYLENNEKIDFSILYILGFLTGVMSGKMSTLLFYKLISKQVTSKAAFVSRKINQLIAFLLLFAAFFQFIKTFVN